MECKMKTLKAKIVFLALALAGILYVQFCVDLASMMGDGGQVVGEATEPPTN